MVALSLKRFCAKRFKLYRSALFGNFENQRVFQVMCKGGHNVDFNKHIYKACSDDVDFEENEEKL